MTNSEYVLQLITIFCNHLKKLSSDFVEEDYEVKNLKDWDIESVNKKQKTV